MRSPCSDAPLAVLPPHSLWPRACSWTSTVHDKRALKSGDNFTPTWLSSVTVTTRILRRATGRLEGT